jgi:hypothetical protein
MDEGTEEKAGSGWLKVRFGAGGAISGWGHGKLGDNAIFKFTFFTLRLTTKATTTVPNVEETLKIAGYHSSSRACPELISGVRVG